MPISIRAPKTTGGGTTPPPPTPGITTVVSPVTQLQKDDGATHIWTLGDAPGSFRALDAVGSSHAVYKAKRSYSNPSGTIREKSSTFKLGSPGAFYRDPTTCARFNGTTQMVVTPFTGLTGSQKGSLECWFRPRFRNTSVNVRILSTSPLSVNSDHVGVELVWLQADRSIGAYIGTSSGVNLLQSAANAVCEGYWSHIVMTWDHSGTNQIYDLYVDQVRANPRGVMVTDVIGGSYLVIGCGQGYDGDYADGHIQNVAVYPTALTQAQVTAHADLASGVNVTMQSRVAGGPTRLWGIAGPDTTITKSTGGTTKIRSYTSGERTTIFGQRMDFVGGLAELFNGGDYYTHDSDWAAWRAVNPNFEVYAYLNTVCLDSSSAEGIMPLSWDVTCRLKNDYSGTGVDLIHFTNGRYMMQPGQFDGSTDPSGADPYKSWRQYLAKCIVDILNGIINVQTARGAPAPIAGQTWKIGGIPVCLNFMFDDFHPTRTGHNSMFNDAGTAKKQTDNTAAVPADPATNAAYSDASWGFDNTDLVRYVTQYVRRAVPSIAASVGFMINGMGSYEDGAVGGNYCAEWISGHGGSNTVECNILQMAIDTSKGGVLGVNQMMFELWGKQQDQPLNTYNVDHYYDVFGLDYVENTPQLTEAGYVRFMNLVNPGVRGLTGFTGGGSAETLANQQTELLGCYAKFLLCVDGRSKSAFSWFDRQTGENSSWFDPTAAFWAGFAALGTVMGTKANQRVVLLNNGLMFCGWSGGCAVFNPTGGAITFAIPAKYTAMTPLNDNGTWGTPGASFSIGANRGGIFKV